MIDIVKQKQIDPFVSRLPLGVLTNDMFKDLIRYGATIVRAANAAGWFEPKLENIDDMPPKQVISYAQDVITAYGKSLEISPE